MERAQVDKLATKLRMTAELSPLLDAEGGLSRFEHAIVECLSQYMNKQRVFIRGRHIIPHSNGVFVRDSGTISLGPNAIDYFCRYYGVGYEAKSMAGVGADVDRIAQAVSVNVRHITMILEGNNKRDLWYGTL